MGFCMNCSKYRYMQFSGCVTQQGILIPRAYDPSGLWQGSRALALSNTRNPQFRLPIKSGKSYWLRI